MKKCVSQGSAIESFEPIADENSQILILGTMPGEESLRQQQYYAHPRNLFWPYIYQIFGEKPDAEYEKRAQFLHDKKIALWDVFRSCEREGSLDSNIQNEKPNDIAGLLEGLPNIKYVFCNGGTAWKEFRKKALPQINRRVYPVQLPSTSPANASISYESKLKQWMQVRYALENRVLHESHLKTGMGLFRVLSDGAKITRVCLPGADRPAFEQVVFFGEDEVGNRTVEQIREYLNGRRKTFSIPFIIGGTPFQQSVYQALLQVPYGSTISYGELAEKAGNRKASRAVGQTVRKNPLPLLVPCHRVIGSNGKNVGFMGVRNNPLQNTLIELEKNNR